MSSGGDTEFTIRVTGTAPPPLPSPKASGRGGVKGTGRRGKQATSQPKKQQQQQRRYNLRLRPSSTLDQLQKDVFSLFGVPPTQSRYQLSYLTGFPPKELNPRGKSNVFEMGIRPNESVIVKFSLIDSPSDAGQSVANGSAKPEPMKTDSVSEVPAKKPETGSTGRQKRASAMAATASFRDAIAAQNSIMRKESSRKKKSNKRGAADSNASSSGRIAGIGTGGATGGQVGRPKKIKMEGTGYRLSDGKSFESSSRTNQRKNNTKQKPLFRSEDDIASTLLSSLGGGDGGIGGNGKVGKFLRAAMRGAVSKSYEASRAAVRVAAVDHNDYEFAKTVGHSDGGIILGTAEDNTSKDDEDAQKDADEEDALGRRLYTVTYSKGLEGRGSYTEEVEIIGLDALKGVLQSVYDSKAAPHEDSDEEEAASGSAASNEDDDGRELLRPVTMAQLSPRVFWSLVYHHRYRTEEKRREKQQTQQLSTNHTDRSSVIPNNGQQSPSKLPQNEQPSANGNQPNLPTFVGDMLRSAMPHLDWSHLDRGGRKRMLSEKAKENLRQKQMANHKSIPSSNQGSLNVEGIKAIEEIERSILNSVIGDNGEEDGQKESGSELNERERRARAALARFDNQKDDIVSKLTPPVASVDNNDFDDWKLVTPSEDDIDELIECIIGETPQKDGSNDGLHPQEISMSWVKALLQSDSTTQIRNWRELANASPEIILSKLNTISTAHLPSIDTTIQWINAAQQRSIDEIMLEILDGDQDALEALVKGARSGTPKDLSFWSAAPTMLLSAISSSTLERENEEKSWVEKDIIRWIYRAKIAMEMCPWLEMYSTSVA